MEQKRRGWSRGAAAAVVAGGLAIALASADPASGHGWSGRAVLRDVAGNRVGTVRFDGERDATDVKVTLRGVAPGFHGFHIHANESGAACDPLTPPAFSNVGPHWDLTTGALHGAHSGDLPSVLVSAGGSATARSVTDRLDPARLNGRAVILHAGPDNFANIPMRYSVNGVPGPDSDTTSKGDAGDRLACGVITVD